MSSPTIADNIIRDNVGDGAIYVHLSELIIEDNAIVGNDSGIICNESPCAISGNYISENSTGAIYCYQSDCTISENLISRNGTQVLDGPSAVWVEHYLDGAIYAGGSSVTILNNVITDNLMGGVKCSCSAPDSVTIANNVIAGNASRGIYLGISSSGITICNNTIVANGDFGIQAEDYTSFVCRNNIIAFNAYGITSQVQSGTVQMYNNCVYGNMTDFSPSGVHGQNTVEADPLLASVAYCNMHVQPESPCIDAGDDTGIGETWTDIDGQDRTQGDHVDIGADESDGALWSAGPYAIIYVKPNGVDANDGSTWASAKQTVQAGIDAASGVGGDVWVAEGTYENVEDEFLWLRPFATVYGGFNGDETRLNQRNIAGNPAVLYGNGARVSYVYSGSHTVIDGCTVTNGGRGLLCTGAQPTLRRDTFTGNVSGSEGGGVFCINNSSITIEKCQFIANATSEHGGAIALHTTKARIVNSIFAGNTAADPTGSTLRPKDLQCEIINNTFVGNRSSQGYGGAINCGITCTVKNNIFYDNTAVAGWSTNGPAAISYCDAYNPGQSNTQSNHYRNPNSVSNALYSDPLFVDAGYWNGSVWVNGDYHLQSNSPCIDQGTNTGAPLEDLDGRAVLSTEHAT